MAKIVTDNIVISVSKIARDGDAEENFVPVDVKAEIETLVAALVGDSYVVEVLS